MMHPTPLKALVSFSTLSMCLMAMSSQALASGSDVLLDQPLDWQNGLRSERDTPLPDSRTADDFRLQASAELDTLTAWFISDRRVPLVDWEVSIHEDAGGMPGSLIARFMNGESTDTGGDWDPRHKPQLGLFRVTWSLEGLSLQRGRYWFIARGVGDQRLFQQAYWCTSRTGRPRGFEALFQHDFFFPHLWIPWSDVDIDFLLDRDLDFHNVPFDAAWRLTGTMDDRTSGAEVVSISVVEGTLVSGNPQSVIENDGNELVMRSPGSPDGRSQIRTKIAFSVDDPSMHTLDVDVAFRLIDGFDGSATIFLRNWRTNRYDRIARGSIGLAEQREAVAGIAARDYVHPTGRVVVLVRHRASSHQRSFLAAIDQVAVVAR